MTVLEFNNNNDTDFKTIAFEGYEYLDVDVDETSAWTIVRMIEEGVPLRRNWIQDKNNKSMEIFQIGDRK